jgi:hypothetical protein
VLLGERSSMNHAEILSLSTDKPATKFDDGPVGLRGVRC